MSKRKRITSDVEANLLAKCARRCALCFAIDGDTGEKHGQIAHLDGRRDNNSEDNLVFLCMPHHSLYDSKTSQHKNYTKLELIRHRETLYKLIEQGAHIREPEGAGGPGGSARVVGRTSGAMGGSGGEGGLGSGGAGGNAEVTGDNCFARGGDGGNAAKRDGRGGRRTLSQGERLNLPSDLWPYGYGGAGANTPEYDRRLALLMQIRNEYKLAFPCDVPFIEAGVDQVPTRWVNKRLEEMAEPWRVDMLDGGYRIFDI